VACDASRNLPPESRLWITRQDLRVDNTLSQVSSGPFRPRSRPPLQHPQLAPYAPVIQRATDEVQVGVDPDAALVFRGAGFTALLDLLDGSQPTSAVRRAARAAGLTAAQVRGALDALASAGLLSERDTTPYAGSVGS
jgi:hypothetical protein